MQRSGAPQLFSEERIGIAIVDQSKSQESGTILDSSQRSCVRHACLSGRDIPKR